jgi:hypothetical protein
MVRHAGHNGDQPERGDAVGDSTGMEQLAKPAIRLHIELWTDDRARIRDLAQEYGVDAVMSWLLPEADVLRYVRSVFAALAGGTGDAVWVREKIS